MLKITGALLVCASGAALGLYYAMRGRLAIEELSELRKALAILRAEIEFALNPLGAAAANVAARTRGEAGGFFGRLADELDKPGVTAGQAWERAAEGLGGALDYEDVDQLAQLGRTLGYLDKQMQTAGIALAERYIDGKTARLEEKHRRDSRVYGTAGVACGAMAAIALM